MDPPIDPLRAQGEIGDWQQRLARALEAAERLPAPTAGVTPVDVRLPIGRRAELLGYYPGGDWQGKDSAAPPSEETAPSPQRQERPPVLIVYSLVNRPFILDLTAERSWIRRLRAAGHPVYLLDWREPQGADRFISLDEHIDGGLAAAAVTIADRHDGQKPHLLGICQGGTFALCLAALRPNLLKRLVLLVTPVDFATPEDRLSQLAQGLDFERIGERLGNISAHWLNAFFVALKPYRLLSQRYLDFPELAEQPQALEDFMRLERWMYDSPRQPRAAFTQFARDFYQRNGLLNGTLELCGEPLTLDQVRAPTLNIYAAHDHLVPAAAAQALRDHIGTPHYREIAFAGGHLGVFISRRAHRELLPEVLAWLATGP
ncbi:class III poly(R)-hydroxyalkanoic acid synthase subunit PhaC [Halorhodospira abdelmalekii]|nr:class III poly(R)-hydroxyalkanoic acid synthase subunit PhaC [Halorhodospira abdelmalekii]